MFCFSENMIYMGMYRYTVSEIQTFNGVKFQQYHKYMVFISQTHLICTYFEVSLLYRRTKNPLEKNSISELKLRQIIDLFAGVNRFSQHKV